MPTVTLTLSHLTCAGCVKTIEAALAAIPTIDCYTVSFAECLATIEGAAGCDEAAIAAIAAAGYGAARRAESTAQASQAKESDVSKRAARSLLCKFIVAFVSGCLLWWLDTTSWVPTLTSRTGQISWGVLGLATLVVMLYAGGHMYRGAWSAIKFRLMNMDTLVSVGTGAAWVYSMVMVMAPHLSVGKTHNLYFDASLFILGLIDLGALFEMRARGSTSQALEKLIDMQPATALRVCDQGMSHEVAVSSLVVGDLIHVKPGAKVPVDGIIERGASHVVESMLTGEAVPVRKTIGDCVYGGTLNKSGSFYCRVTKASEDTLLSQMVALVKQAQATKPPIAKLADQISAIFTPIVLVVAVITALVWLLLGYPASHILTASMSVLIIACPCALGLATPLSVMVAMGKAAGAGLLIRNAAVLQRASQLTTIVFDKTGTITRGEPVVHSVHTFHAHDVQAVLRFAGSLEKQSEHPLAEAVVRAADEQSVTLVDVTGFEAMAGQGVVGCIGQQTVSVGNDALMQHMRVATDVCVESVNALTQAACTSVYVAVDGQLVGVMGFRDAIKEEAVDVVAQLRASGHQVVMLTGDTTTTAQVIAKEVGIERVVANVSPSDKLDTIQSLQADGAVVAMVGDGVNDAAALTQADVGFAIGAGSDVAIESADITLVGSSLSGIAQAIDVSKATMRNIKQNLVGAFFYNVVCIPIAAGVLYPVLQVLLNPILASAVMACSSITVVLNANRLRFYRYKR